MDSNTLHFNPTASMQTMYDMSTSGRQMNNRSTNKSRGGQQSYVYYQQPMGGQSPMGYQPPMGVQPMMGYQPPMGVQPMMESQPHMGYQPPMGVQPMMGYQPPMGVQPMMGYQPPMGVQPMMGYQPPMGGQPMMGYQPPMGGQQHLGYQPMMGDQSMMGNQPPMGGQPPMWDQPHMRPQHHHFHQRSNNSKQLSPHMIAKGSMPTKPSMGGNVGKDRAPSAPRAEKNIFVPEIVFTETGFDMMLGCSDGNIRSMVMNIRSQIKRMLFGKLQVPDETMLLQVLFRFQNINLLIPMVHSSRTSTAIEQFCKLFLPGQYVVTEEQKDVENGDEYILVKITISSFESFESAKIAAVESAEVDAEVDAEDDDDSEDHGNSTRVKGWEVSVA